MKINAKRLLLPLFLIAIPFTYGLKKVGEFFYSFKRPHYGFFDHYRLNRLAFRGIRLLMSSYAAYGAGTGGAALGALLGTLAFPGIGTLVGGVVGAVLGSLFGMSVGNWLIRQLLRGACRLEKEWPINGHPNHVKYLPDRDNRHAQIHVDDVKKLLHAFSEKRRENNKKLSRWAHISFFFGSEQDKAIQKENEYLSYATGRVRNGDIVAVEQLVPGVGEEVEALDGSGIKVENGIVLQTTYMAAKPRNDKGYQPTMRFSITQSWCGMWSKLEVFPCATQTHRHDPLFRFSARK